MKIFLDTNVLIAACLAEHEHHDRALPWMQTVHERKAAGFVSAHSLLEVYSTLTRLPRSPRMHPLQAVSLVEENVARHFTQIALSAREYLELINQLGKAGTAGGQVYDALHLACAKKSGAERVFTFNLGHFRNLADGELRSRIVGP